MNRYIHKFAENRVRRNYTGGAGIDMLRRKALCKDANMPEDWIASCVPARNKGMEDIADEGISNVVDANGQSVPFTDFLQQDDSFHLGKAHVEEFGLNTAFLTKVLDSSMRLHVQAHPDKQYAKTHFQSRWGKFEAYYIVGVRPGYEGYIRLGFQRPVTKREWCDIVNTQDIEKMDGLFDKIPVRAGEVWYVPGGLPHAIGEGVIMIEVMEPTDLVARCEFVRNGITVPEEARFMGLKMEDIADMFDYTVLSKEQIADRYRVAPAVLRRGEGHQIESLIRYPVTDCFEMDKITLDRPCTLEKGAAFCVMVVVKGGMNVAFDGESAGLCAGESCFISADCPSVRLVPCHDELTQVCVIRPGVK